MSQDNISNENSKFKGNASHANDQASTGLADETRLIREEGKSEEKLLETSSHNS